MSRQVLALSLLAGIAACSGGEVTTTSDQGNGPSLAISDATHGGNPDFSFRPPMGPGSSGGSAFNPNLSPTITIQPRNNANTADVGSPIIFTNVPVTLGIQYQRDWTVPTSPQIIYRISVKVGTKLLGFADLATGAKQKDLNGYPSSQYVTQLDGAQLPIKFTIGQYALCATPGVGPCGSETLELEDGGDVTFTPTGSSLPSGVVIPPEPTGTQTTITVQSCDDFNPRVTDLPTYGKCVRITADPALPPDALTDAATVFVCDLHGLDGNVNSHDQEERITLHRLDVDGSGNHLAALPHIAGCAPITASVDRSLKGLLANLIHGRLGKAGAQVLAMFRPTPLYARRLNEGAGGSTDEFSDFQFMLPGKIEKTAGDGQSSLPGSTLPVNPQVRVTDLGGEPIRGARVRWAGDIAACQGLAAGSGANTDISGYASTSWTLSATPGANSLVACGRGIGGDDNSGPRSGVDPFQPFPYSGPPAAEAGTPSGPVTLLTGSVMFTAYGLYEPVSSGFFDFGSGGWSSKQIASADPSPSGWYQPGFNAPGAGFTIGSSAGFGTGGSCGFSPGTAWALNTDILLRKNFSLAAAQSINIEIRIDNDLVDLYLNGVKLNPTTLTHEGCAGVGGNAIYTASAVAGVNILAIRARDRGGEAYIDIKVASAAF